MIHILLFRHIGTEVAAKRIRSKEEWKKAHDKWYNEAKRKTFGNLIKAVLKIPEFTSLSTEFAEIKNLRDYFAYHFFVKMLVCMQAIMTKVAGIYFGR